MKIMIDHNDGTSFSIKFPNWLVFNRLGLGFAAKSMVKQNGSFMSVKIGDACKEDELPKPEKARVFDKKEFKKAVKRMKKGLICARGDLRSFLKRNPDFLLVDVKEASGERVRISF